MLSAKFLITDMNIGDFWDSIYYTRFILYSLGCFIEPETDTKNDKLLYIHHCYTNYDKLKLKQHQKTIKRWLKSKHLKVMTFLMKLQNSN